MFTETAEFYDAIYFAFKDYAAEAALIAQRIRSMRPGALRVLDIACGTGEHARILSSAHGFEVDGIDLNPDFVRLAQARNPTGKFRGADMTDFDLGDRYDAIICMFSSIGYVVTLEKLESALRAFRRHVTDDGVVIVEPWLPPEGLTPGYRGVQRAQHGGAEVERAALTEISGRVSRLHFDYRIIENGVTRHASEVHELGLFTEDEMLAAFRTAGFQTRFEPPASPHRGLYISTPH